MSSTRQHLDDARKALVERNISYWSRGWGRTKADKVAAVLADPEWRRLIDQELVLEPLDQDARAVRLAISRMEHCHESFRANAEAVVHMIASIGRGPLCIDVLDCGQTGETRRTLVDGYVAALQRWTAGQPGVGTVDRSVAELCGSPDDRKRRLANHLIEKLKDHRYWCGEDDWSATESLIAHLEPCSAHWQRSLVATLKEIGTGIRATEFHVDGGWGTCGDAPERALDVADLLRDLDAWLDGKAPARLAHLAPRTPVSRWLVGSLCKHVRSQLQTGRIVR